MAAIDFPNSPSNGQIFSSDGKSWKYNSTKGIWQSVVSSTTKDLTSLDLSIIPSANVTYDLGSATNAFRDLYLSGSSINLGDATITSTGGTITLPAGSSVGSGSVGDVANSYLTSTYVANNGFQSYVANTNSYIASVDTAKLETTDVDYSMMLTQQGTLSTTTGTARWYAPYNIATNSIKAYVETAPVGSALSIDIKKNGTSAATPSISDGAVSATEITSAVSLTAGDYLTVDITGVGSSTAGENLNIVFKYKRT